MGIKNTLETADFGINSANFQYYSRPIKLAAASGRGFTLIELLVVIAIVGLLASVILVALNNSRTSARIAKRKTDARQIRKAIEFYFQDNGVYPNKGTVGNQNTVKDIQSLTSFLVPKYLARLPNDPKDSPNNYEYEWDNKGLDYGLLVPFGDDGGQNCMFRSPNGNVNWFKVGNKKVPDCSYSQ